MAKHIDQIYKQYASRIIKYVSSTEFYEYFMMMVESGKNTMQFSNRRVEKTVDETWVTAIEAAMKPMEEIINNPRNFIIQEEIIVNVALAKKITPDTVRHLAQHGSLIDRYDEKEGVRPNRLMEKSKEDSWNTYENRFVYTLLEMTYEFVNKRYEAIFAALNQEEGAFLKLSTEAVSYNESMSVNLDIRVRQQEDLLSSDKKNENIFARIARLHRLLNNFRGTRFAKEVAKYGKIKPPLVRTNAIAKNPNFKACHKLWNFILAYTDIGYNINIYEQNPEISEGFMMDIFHSVMFDYIILKNYLEDPRDREVHSTAKMKHKKLKPKFIKEIIEEIVKNYDLPDVEVRKILIEEITKAQLMQEEEAVRLRLVEEKEKEMRKRRQEEEREKARKAKEELKERIRKEKEAEKERLRLEKEQQKEAERIQRQKELFQQDEDRLEVDMALELQKCAEDIQFYIDRKQAIQEQLRKQAEEEQQRQREAQLAREAAEREKERIAREKAAQAEKERIAREKAKEKERIAKEKERAAKEKAAQAERDRLAREKAREKERIAKEKAALAEKERIAKEKERAAKEKAAQAERERIAREKAREKERLAREKEKAAQEKAALAEKERLAKEKAKEKAAQEKAAQAERDRLAREKAREKERLAREKAALAEKERIAKEKERAAKEKAAQAERDRLAREKAREKERLAREKEKAAKEKAAQAEKERLAREKAKEKERIAKEKAAQAEKERIAKEKAREKERIAKEKAKEKERLAREKAKEKERAAKAKAKGTKVTPPSGDQGTGE